MKTSKQQLEILKKERETAVAAYNKYLKEYNTEHQITGRTIIKEIITLHKQGLDNKAIIAKGYNKWTVNEQVRQFVKGKRVAKTIVAKWLPKKDKK